MWNHLNLMNLSALLEWRETTFLTNPKFVRQMRGQSVDQVVLADDRVGIASTSILPQSRQKSDSSDRYPQIAWYNTTKAGIPTHRLLWGMAEDLRKSTAKLMIINFKGGYGTPRGWVNDASWYVDLHDSNEWTGSEDLEAHDIPLDALCDQTCTRIDSYNPESPDRWLYQLKRSIIPWCWSDENTRQFPDLMLAADAVCTIDATEDRWST